MNSGFIDYMINHWEGIAAIVGGLFAAILTLSDKTREWVKSPFERKKTSAEIGKDILVANNEGDTALINTIQNLKTQLATNIDVGTELNNINVQIRNKINEQQIEIDLYIIQVRRCKLAFTTLLDMCEEHCLDSNFCKSKIEEILKDLKLNNNVV